jgi:DMSO/TMAO reductase YedYZ heme-binding membrane subunit
MLPFSDLRSTFSDRTKKKGAFIALLVATTAVLVFIGTVGNHLAIGTQLGVLISHVPGISNKTPWHLSRSAGTVAYLLLLGSTVWGLLLSSKIVKEAIPAALALAMHTILSWLALAFTGLHAQMLLLDSYYSYTVLDLMIPFMGPYRPGWVALGIVSFYMTVLVTLSFSFRKQLGQKRWRKLHYLSFALFILATLHGFMAGTDSLKSSMRFMYLGSGLLVLFLSNYRLLTRHKEHMNH